MKHKKRSAAAIALAAALVSGCDADKSSFADTDPADQVEAARDAMSDLRAVHLTGILTNDGRPLDVDLALADDGSCAGTLGVDGGTAEVRTAEGERRGGEAPATMTFSDFDVVPDVTAPDPDEVVDPAELDALVG